MVGPKPATPKAQSPKPKAVVIPERGDATVRVDGRDRRQKRSTRTRLAVDLHLSLVPHAQTLAVPE